jgi:AAA domain, putative AbiEii toxin, Type IV TA system
MNPTEMFPTTTALAELPDLSIITGLNGVGKSQLLALLNIGAIEVVDDEDPTSSRPRLLQTIFSIQPSQQQSRVNPSTYTESVGRSIRDIVEAAKESLEAKRIPDKIRLQMGLPLESQEVSNSQDEMTVLEGIVRGKAISSNILSEQGYALLRKRLGTSISQRSSEEIGAALVGFETHQQTWELNLQDRFRLYAQVKENHLLNQFKHQRGRIRYDVTDEEFNHQHGPEPWLTLNSVLDAIGLHYRVSEPSLDNNNFYHLFLTREDGISVGLDQLSSGETVLMNLALGLYANQRPHANASFPRLLLLDEVDALLHPSMIDTFLRVLRDVFVKQLGLRIIVTTHSSTTVSLADEGSVFLLERYDGQPSLRGVTCNEAVQALAVGVPTLLVRNEHRRLIWTESEYDAEHYQTVYEMVKDHLKTPLLPIFVGSAKEKGANCDAVMNVVQTIREAGVDTVYGVIDWDGGKRRKNAVARLETPPLHGAIHVIGENERYSCENWILDPVVMTHFMHREAVRLELGRHFPGFKARNDGDLLSLSPTDWQSAVDDMFQSLFPREDNTSSRLECGYVAGFTLHLPSWYLTKRGHDLENDWVMRNRVLQEEFRTSESAKRLKGNAFKMRVLQTSFNILAPKGLIPNVVQTMFKAVLR